MNCCRSSAAVLPGAMRRRRERKRRRRSRGSGRTTMMVMMHQHRCHHLLWGQWRLPRGRNGHRHGNRGRRRRKRGSSQHSRGCCRCGRGFVFSSLISDAKIHRFPAADGLLFLLPSCRPSYCCFCYRYCCYYRGPLAPRRFSFPHRHHHRPTAPNVC